MWAGETQTKKEKTMLNQLNSFLLDMYCAFLTRRIGTRKARKETRKVTLRRYRSNRARFARLETIETIL